MFAPRRRLPGELVFMLLLLGLSAFLLWQAYGISGFESITSAGVFPMLAALTMVLSLLVVVKNTAQSPRSEAPAGEALFAQFVRQLTPGVVVAFTAAIAAYMLLLEPLGFVVSSSVFLIVSMRLLGSTRWVLNLAVSAVSLGLIYVVFHTVFSVVLPKGTLLQGLLP